MLPLTWVSLFSCQLYGYMESEPLTLQLFIGTADDRLLRPHAFYQVHRITGKTVSTASHEVMQSNTKILEIPLLPENNMRAMWVLSTLSSINFKTQAEMCTISFFLHLSLCYVSIGWECLLINILELSLQNRPSNLSSMLLPQEMHKR